MHSKHLKRRFENTLLVTRWHEKFTFENVEGLNIVEKKVFGSREVIKNSPHVHK